MSRRHASTYMGYCGTVGLVAGPCSRASKQTVLLFGSVGGAQALVVFLAAPQLIASLNTHIPISVCVCVLCVFSVWQPALLAMMYSLFLFGHCPGAGWRYAHDISPVWLFDCNMSWVHDVKKP